MTDNSIIHEEIKKENRIVNKDLLQEKLNELREENIAASRTFFTSPQSMLDNDSKFLSNQSYADKLDLYLNAQVKVNK